MALANHVLMVSSMFRPANRPPARIPGARTLLAVWLALALAAPVPAAQAQRPAQPAPREVVCVDGGNSGAPFEGVTCDRTVTNLESAADGLQAGSLVVVRAFTSSDPNSIDGTGTYRGEGLLRFKLLGTQAEPIIFQAEHFDASGDFERPIVSGAERVTGDWVRTPGTQATWETPWEVAPGSWGHTACVDRIWVSRPPGRTALANFPLTRPMPNQGNDYPDDCGDNTLAGQPMTPQAVDDFPGSYEWLDGRLYVHLPGGEDPNEHTIEVPVHHSLSPGRGSTGLIIRGFRVYHTVNGIDLWHCGTSPADRCEATHNETSYNTHFGLQPGRYGLLAYNTGQFNTIQLIKITSDFSEIAYNRAGTQLAHGFKLNEVKDCYVHDNVVFGNRVQVTGGTQAGWGLIGTRDAVAGIYLKNGTQRCRVEGNLVAHNNLGLYLRNDGDTLTEANTLQGNRLLYNSVALAWRDAGLWTYNTAADNVFSPNAQVRWDEQTGSVSEFLAATGQDPAASR
jgi:parallel beta-helix repeat protein